MHFPGICRPKFQKYFIRSLPWGPSPRSHWTKQTVEKLNLCGNTAVDKSAWIKVGQYERILQYRLISFFNDNELKFPKLTIILLSWNHDIAVLLSNFRINFKFSIFDSDALKELSPPKLSKLHSLTKYVQTNLQNLRSFHSWFCSMPLSYACTSYYPEICHFWSFPHQIVQ